MSRPCDDLVLGLVDSRLKGGDNVFRVLYSKDGRSSNNDVAPLSKIIIVLDFTGPGLSCVSTYQRQHMHRSSWVQHRHLLRYLCPGTGHAAQTLWAHICPRISDHPCLYGPLSTMECDSRSPRLTWIDGHHEKHISQVSDLVGNGSRRRVG